MHKCRQSQKDRQITNLRWSRGETAQKGLIVLFSKAHNFTPTPGWTHAVVKYDIMTDVWKTKVHTGVAQIKLNVNASNLTLLYLDIHLRLLNNVTRPTSKNTPQ